MLDMTGMTRILEIGHDFVTAEAGALYIDVAEELARRGKQFHINTEIGNVTLVRSPARRPRTARSSAPRTGARSARSCRA